MFEFFNITNKYQQREYDVQMLLQREFTWFISLSSFIKLCNEQEHPKATAKAMIKMWKDKMQEAFNIDLESYRELSIQMKTEGNIMASEEQLISIYEEGMETLMEKLQPVIDKLKERKDGNNNQD